MNYGYYMEPVVDGLVRIVTLMRPREIQLLSNEKLFNALSFA